jgi:hypothetical protein
LHDDSWANFGIEQVIDEESTSDNIVAEVSVDIDAAGARATLETIVRPNVLVGDGHEAIHGLLEKIAGGEAVLRAER